MNKQALRQALKAAIEGSGGQLDNGWFVTVKTRTTGARDLRIITDEGKVLRSLKQALAALEETSQEEADMPGRSELHAADQELATRENADSYADGIAKASQQPQADRHEVATAAVMHEPTASERRKQHVAKTGLASISMCEDVGAATPVAEEGAKKLLEDCQQAPRRSTRVQNGQLREFAEENVNLPKRNTNTKGASRQNKNALEGIHRPEREPGTAKENGKRQPDQAKGSVVPNKKARSGPLPASGKDGRGSSLSKALENFKARGEGKDAAPKRKPTFPTEGKEEGRSKRQKSLQHCSKSRIATKKAEDATPAPNGGTPTEHPVFTKLIAKAKLHVARIRRELDILDVYKAEGWRGANKDKLKPRAEMQRAEQQIEKSKAALREMLERCEAAEGRRIPADKYDDNGELDQEHIFCAICDIAESHDDNDIVLCDGPCHRAYHEKCCIPSFNAAEMPEDSDWLCPACHAKSLQDEVLDMISESFDFRYELETPADAVFQTIGTLQRKTSNSAAKDSIGKRGSGTWSSWFLLNSEELVSSDTDDESFRAFSEDDTEANASCSSNDEDASQSGKSQMRSPSSSNVNSSNDGGEEAREDSARSSEATSIGVVVEGRRLQRKVDYVAMNAEMFGDEEDLEGEASDDSWS